MAGRKTLSGEERRNSIIGAAARLFAENGYHGTSIRQIARAAEVSEALIYKHFMSKEELYEETLNYSRSMLSITTEELESLPLGTWTLVAMVYLAVSLIALDVPGRTAEQRAHERLLFQSLTGDISFARRHFKNLEESWAGLLQANYEAAVAAGDFLPCPESARNRMWFVHHLAMAINLCHLSGEPAFEYEGTREELVEQAVLFCLRGGGMTPEAIDKYYQPRELRALREQILGVSTKAPEDRKRSRRGSKAKG